MLAVVAVILDHLVAWPSGGFVGVDVFFVISGFLITGILVREHERTNHISFVGFYRRRLKRIMPAATLTLVVTVIAAFLLFNSSRYMQTFWDAIYAFFFTANWHFAAAGTDYFQAAGPVSPLQHFWSLSVEEQFYFVWPWLMFGVLALAGLRKGFTRRRTLTGVLMAAIVVATFTWALFETTSNPTIAYFSTITRAWELGFGALLAIATPWWSKIPNAMRPILGWVGFLGILASYFIINDTLPFPAPWAALPVIATALVIAAGTGGEQRYLYPLTNPVSVYVGNVSYSLYLWHFPIIIFAGVIIGSNPWIYFPVTIVLMGLFAIGSYYLVEEPIQKSPWLEPARRSTRRANWVQWRHQFGDRLRYGSMGGLALVSVTLVAIGLVGPQASAPPIAAADAFSAVSDAEDGAPTALEVEQQAISDAVRAKEFPVLVPAIADLGFNVWADQMKQVGCVNVTQENLDACVFGPADSEKDVVVFGDSYAMAWMPGIRAGLEAAGWRVHQLTFAECPSADVEVTHSDGTAYPECAPWRAWAEDTIDQLKPELTIVTSADTNADRMATGATSVAMKQEIQTGSESVLSRVTASSERTVVLGAPPRGNSLQYCATPGATPGDCATRAADPWVSYDAAQAAAAEAAGVEYIGTRSWFCNADGWCPSFAVTTPIRTDSSHLTIEFSTLLGPVLKEAIDPAEESAESVVLASQILKDEVLAALQATTWPSDLTPSLDDVAGAKNPELETGTECLNPTNFTDPALCTFDDGDKTAVVVGDSFAIATMPAIRGVLAPLGYKTRGIGISTCPFADVDMTIRTGQDATDTCNNNRQAVIDLVNAINPAIVVVLDSEFAYAQMTGPFDDEQQHTAAFTAGRVSSVEQVAAEGRGIFIVAPTPGATAIAECATKVGTPADCVGELSEWWKSHDEADKAAAAQLGATYIETRDWYCSETACPAFAGTTPIRWDSGHMTAAYSQKIIPALAEALIPDKPQ